MNHLIHQIHPESAGLLPISCRALRPLITPHSRVAPKDLQVLPVGSRNYMTPRGHHQLQEELRTLLRVECPRASMVLAADSRTGSPSQRLDLLHQIGARE